MKTVTTIIIAVGLLIVNDVSALDPTGSESLPMARDARHTIMPFIGYQILDGEQMRFKLSDSFFDPVSLTFFSVDEDQQFETNAKSPEIGIIYRYKTPLNMLMMEAGVSLIHDAENYKRSYIIQFRDYTDSGSIIINHKNTMVYSLAMIVSVPTGLRWLTSNLSVGGGYAKRDINASLGFEPGPNTSFEISDSKELLMTRIGLEFALWNKEKFLTKGSIYYSNMSPLDDRNDAFGGIGWSFGFFPIWSAAR